MGWKMAIAVIPLEGRTLTDVVNDVYGINEPLTAIDISAQTAINPRWRQRNALTHERFAWICDWTLVERSFKKPLALKESHSFMLHSVVNAYGFANVRDGKFLRSRQGTSDNGIPIDVGSPTPSERALVTRNAKPGQQDAAWQAWTDADKTFDQQIELTDAQGVRKTKTFEGMTHDTIGEEIVFGLMGELVGFRIDEDSPKLDAFLKAQVMRVGPAKRSLFGWLSR
jgi:hypothetical protein